MLNFSTELVHYDLNSIRTNTKKFSLKQILVTKIKITGKSLGLFTTSNRFRQFCSNISQHWLFNLIIIALILIQTGIQTQESPLKDPESEE